MKVIYPVSFKCIFSIFGRYMTQDPNVKKDSAPHPPTNEQKLIIETDLNLRINAIAGSGKTTTLIEYVAAKSPKSRFLYLAFNRSVKLEAEKKFRGRGLFNVQVETAHSLAYRYIVAGGHYKVRQGYKIHELAELLKFPPDGEKHAGYILANHINKFISYFCNSDKAKVQELNYLDTLTESQTVAFVKKHYRQIESGTRQLLAAMDKGEISVIHDFYLKKFQLSKPVLPYDYILFDEGQDASAAMLDVFLKQEAIRIIVGDTHQQIYGWRYAVNSLEKTDFTTRLLSTSFRFPQDIADLASAILDWKKHLGEYIPIPISGQGNSTASLTTATIARTNLGLLLKAIHYITDNSKVKHIYFEGNINSYTYAEDGASLYDVLNLYNGNYDRIRDKLIRSMADMDELEDYIEKTEDMQLAMMVEIVKEYENEIFTILKQLKELHTGDHERHKAEMIFSTVHRAKGMEYDEVHLVNDFITEAKLEKAKSAKKENPPDIPRLNEEINLLYVAITRAKNKLYIPEALMPENFKPSPHIKIVKGPKDHEAGAFQGVEPGMATSKRTSLKKPTRKARAEKPYIINRQKGIKEEAHQRWTPELDRELRRLYDNNESVSRMAEKLGRTKGAVIARIRKLDYFND